MIKEELVEKIKKILALADSSNPNEAAVALARAQKLMAKYKIESHDLEDLTISEIKVKPITGLKSKECSIRLVSIISKCFGVENLLSYSGHSLTNIIFIGPKEILSSCEYVFTLLSRFALNAQRNFNETVWGETLGELIVDKQLMTIIEKINPQFYTDYLMNEQKTYQSAKENSGIRCREFLNFSGKRFQVYLDVYKDYDYEQCKKYFQKLVSKKRKAFLEGMLHEIYCKVQEFALTDDEYERVKEFMQKNHPNATMTHCSRKGMSASEIAAFQSGQKEGQKAEINSAISNSAPTRKSIGCK